MAASLPVVEADRGFFFVVVESTLSCDSGPGRSSSLASERHATAEPLRRAGCLLSSTLSCVSDSCVAIRRRGGRFGSRASSSSSSSSNRYVDASAFFFPRASSRPPSLSGASSGSLTEPSLPARSFVKSSGGLRRRAAGFRGGGASLSDDDDGGCGGARRATGFAAGLRAAGLRAFVVGGFGPRRALIQPWPSVSASGMSLFRAAGFFFCAGGDSFG